MAAAIDPRVIEELASILEGINPFPNPNEFNFDTCRGFKKGSTNRCGNSAGTAAERKQLADLLSEFRVTTKFVDTNSLYDKVENFIIITHCKRRHREDAFKAFNEWKAQRKTAALNPLPVTPSRSATPHADFSESLSDLSNTSSSSAVPDSLEYDEHALDSYITEKIESLSINPAAQNTQTETDHSCFDEVKAQREKFKSLGAVNLPEKGKEQDNVEIYKKIQNPLSAKSMSGAIVYVLEHTKISGIFKIGVTNTSAELRLKQSNNCYRFETRIIHETEDGPFIGARQAEKIAHAILSHKRILIYECPHCKKSHEEWFLVSRREACSVVKLAERWLKMPAYTLQQGKYKLTPKGNTIFKMMFPFSISKMNVLIDKMGESDNNSPAFSDTTSAAAVGETRAKSVSSATAEKEIPTFCVHESLATTPPRRYNTRERSPVGGVGGKGVTHLIEEIFERHETRSRETTPDGNYMIVTEHSKTIRKKVSRTRLRHDSGVCEGPKPSFPDLKGKKPRSKEVGEVREVHRA